MSEPTYTITLTRGQIWNLLAAYLLGCFLTPFLSAVGEGIVNAFKRRRTHVCETCAKCGMMHCGSECLGDGEDANV